MNAEKKKDDMTDSKDIKNKKMGDSGIMTFSSGGVAEKKSDYYNGSHDNSPVKHSVNLDSPLRVINNLKYIIIS